MNILETICNDKRAHVARCEHLIPQIVHETRARLAPAPLGFVRHIRTKKDFGLPALIAEVKKASPSKGIIRSDFDPVKIAMTYQSAGATCLSVLTDEPYFKGADEDLEAVKAVVQIPVIRKDFMIAPYQIVESRALGADCILIIMAAVDDLLARRLYDTAVGLGMDVLVEVHDEAELDRALALSPMMVGVNARDLKTLAVNLDTAYKLLEKIPPAVVRVAESGIATHLELRQLFESGFDAFLVGESLMREHDIGLAVKNLLGKYAEVA